jgi:hypothetical protein
MPRPPETAPLSICRRARSVCESITLPPFIKVTGRLSKEDHSKEKIETRMCGVRVICGDINEFWIFYTDNMMPGGTNTMIQIFRVAMYQLTVRLNAKGFKLPCNADCCRRSRAEHDSVRRVSLVQRSRHIYTY